MKKFIFLSITCLISFSVFGQAKLIEKFEATNAMDVSYAKYQLPTGLTLLIHEDHSDPVVHLNITYHVGSARELPGKSGFAHFFEHMLFQGSKHVEDEEHFKLIKQYGGDVNGNTTRDRTVYIETFPSNFTETALWMEADRMGVFLEAFTQKKFEIQRATVKNEKSQNLNNPYGFLREVADQQLYPSDHPYSWSTIGYVDDLDRADSNDLKNFFLRWYGPNNAAVIVSGDVNSPDVVKWVEKYFGGIKRGPDVRKQRVRPVVLDKDVAGTYTDINASVPLIYKSYVGVPVLNKDEAALDFLTYLMSSSQNSYLYKKLVDTEKALQVGAQNNPMSSINHELAGEINFLIVGYPFDDILTLQSLLNDAIESFNSESFTDEDLARAKVVFKKSFTSGMESASAKANRLSTSWYLTEGSMSKTSEEWARYEKITKDDIMKAFNKYVKGMKSSTVIIKPLPGNERSEKDKYKYVSFNPNAELTNPAAEAEYFGLVHTPLKDDFDRSIKPTPSAPKAPKVPEVYTGSFKNGMKLYGTESDETNDISVIINIKGGQLLEGGKYPLGTADAMTSSMNEGTALKTPVDLEKALENIASSVSFGAGTTGIRVNLSTDKEHFDEAVKLLQEAMFKPRWDDDKYKKDQKQSIQNAKSALNSKGVGVNNVWRKVMYGDGIMSSYTGANEIAKVSISDCKGYYNDFFAPDHAMVIIGGNISKEKAMKSLDFLNNWEKKGVVITTPTNYNDFKTTQIFGVDYTNSEQAQLTMGFKAMPYDVNGDYFKSQIMNFALGGNFNSRLNLDIRENKGWTYGIRSGFSANYENMPGFYTVSAGIKASSIDSAITQVLYNLQSYKDKGLTQEEFKFTKDALLASQSLEYETLGQKLGMLYEMGNRDLPVDFMQNQQTILQKITKAEVDALAKKNLDIDKMVIVVGGDMFVLKDKLESLGFGKVQVLEPDGSGKVKLNKAGKEPIKHTKNY
jgi:zinc protease